MKKWLALLLALILALGTLSSGAIAAAPEDTKIDWPEVHVYSQITQGVGMYYQQAVAGDTMYLNFELMSTGAENERYYVGVAYKGQEQTPLKTWEGKYPEQKYSELSLAWDTTGLEPGEYIVRYYTIVTESDGSELHVNAGPQAMPLQLVADPIPLQSVGIGDGDQLFTQLYLDVANGDEEKMEFLYIIPEPRNTTEPIKYQVTCDNPSVLKAVCNAGYLRLEGLKPGTANVSVNWAGKNNHYESYGWQRIYGCTEGPWYYEAVQYVAENGLMAGTGNGKFSPDAPLESRDDGDDPLPVRRQAGGQRFQQLYRCPNW